MSSRSELLDTEANGAAEVSAFEDAAPAVVQHRLPVNSEDFGSAVLVNPCPLNGDGDRLSATGANGAAAYHSEISMESSK